MRLKEQLRRRSGSSDSSNRYQMRQQMLAFGDDFWIQDANGKHVFRIDGKVLGLRHTMDLEDAHGTPLCRIQARVMHLRDTMEIQHPDGRRLAMVHRAFITPLRDRWKVDVEDGEDLDVHGNIVGHEYKIESPEKKVAEVSKKWFRPRDTYGIQVLPTEDPVLLLAVSVALDAMAHPAR